MEVEKSYTPIGDENDTGQISNKLTLNYICPKTSIIKYCLIERIH